MEDDDNDEMQNVKENNNKPLKGDKNEKVNNSDSTFNFLYFAIIFLYALSCFTDLIIYFCYYQEKKNQNHFNAFTFGARLFIDILFILPIFIILRFEYQCRNIINIITIVFLLPQIVLNITTYILIFTQGYQETEEENVLTETKIMIIRIVSGINLVFNFLLICFTFIKINRN